MQEVVGGAQRIQTGSHFRNVFPKLEVDQGWLELEDLAGSLCY